MLIPSVANDRNDAELSIVAMRSRRLTSLSSPFTGNARTKAAFQSSTGNTISRMTGEKDDKKTVNVDLTKEEDFDEAALDVALTKAKRLQRLYSTI